MKRIFIILSVMFFAARLSAYFDWQCLKTDQFTVFYGPGFDERALDLLTNLENNKLIPESITGNRLTRVPVMLEDAGDYNQGYADPEFMMMSVFNYEYDEPWFKTTGVHEYTHLLQMSKASGAPSALKFLFGDIMSPNIFLPLWVHEGITTYDESHISMFDGRLNNGSFDAYMGACVLEDRMPSIMKATYSPVEPPMGDAPYIFGGEFTSYLSRTYGEEKLKELYSDIGGDIFMYLSPLVPFFGMDRSYCRVFGKRTDELWADFLASEKMRLAGYKMEGERLTRRGWYMNSLAAGGGKLYYSSTTVEKTGCFSTWTNNRIVERDIKTGIEKEIILRTGQVSKAMKISGGKLYYAVDDIRTGYANSYNGSIGTYPVIYEHDLATGNEREILRAQLNAFCVYNGSLVYSVNKTYTYGSDIYALDLKTGRTERKGEIPYVIYDFAVTQDGRGVYISAKKEEVNLSIYSFDIDKSKLEAVIDTPWSEDHPQIYGDKLFYSADYAKAVRLYCYDLKDKKIYSVVKNGFAQDAAYDPAADEIYFLGINTDGFDLYRKKAEFMSYELPADEQQDFPEKALDKSLVKKGSYLDDLATLWPKLRVPLYYINGEGHDTYGISLTGLDAMSDLSYTTDFNYDSMGQRFSNITTLGLNFFSPLSLDITYADNEARRMSLDVSYPLFLSNTGGLSGIRLGAGYDLYDWSKDSDVSPGISAGFKWPLTALDINAKCFIRDLADYYGNNRSNMYGYTTAVLVHHMPDSNITFTSGFTATDHAGETYSFMTRGHADAPKANSSMEFNAEYTRPILKLRAGLWNPNIYFEDICMNVFCDSVFTRAGNQRSCGAGLQLETRLLFIFPSAVSIQAAYTEEGRTVFIYQLGIVSGSF
jgi:hypothetical protein